MARKLPDRNLALELCRGTEAAAIAAARMMGRGDKSAVQTAAVTAMRSMLSTVHMDGEIVIGEGPNDVTPLLYSGEHIGTGGDVQLDIAVNSIDGARPTALGIGGVISVIAGSPRGTMFNPKSVLYMDKIVVGPEAKDVIDIEASVADNIRRVAGAKKKAIRDMTVVVLNRPRHDKLIAEIRSVGARIKLIPDGDVAGSMLTCQVERGADILMGIGGTSEAIITACAIKSLGGGMQGKLWVKDDEQLHKAVDAGVDLNQVLTADDLVTSDDVFFAATGVTDGDFLDGVRYEGHHAYTSSVVMRSKSGTIRYIQATHSQRKLDMIAGLNY